MRLFSRRSVSPASSDSDSRGNSLPVADTGIHPHLSSDVSGLHQADATIVPSSSSNGRRAPNGHTTPNSTTALSAKAKGKGKAKETPAEDWLQPPGRKLCFRHQRMADEGTNLQLQKALDSLPKVDRETVSNIWSAFSASSHARRALILQGILTMCCQSELSLLSEQLTQLNRIDPFSFFPRELSLKILGFLDARSLTRAAQVSRHWRGLADDDVLWKTMCEQHIERKCYKCGWGLPLLERRSKSGASSPTGAGASANSTPAHHTATSAGPSTSRPSPVQLVSAPSVLTPDHHRDVSPIPPPRSPTMTNSPLPTPRLNLPRNHLTRPWKDVYSERLTIARNWRLGRASATVLKGHTDGVMCLQYNDKLQHPSFPILITGSYDRTVRVWNMETGQEVHRLLGHTRAVRALQFDECKLVTGSMDRTLRLWNWRTGQCIRTLEGHTAGVVCLAFDSNILVSGSVDKTVKVWNFRTGDCFTLRGHVDWVNSVRIWDRFAGIPTSTGEGMDLDGVAPPSQPPALDPGKMVFSASDDGTIRLWDLSTRACVRQFEGHVGQVQSIQVIMADEIEETAAAQDQEPEVEVEVEDSSDEANENPTPPARLTPPLVDTKPLLISGSLDNTIRVWDVETGKKRMTLFGHIEGVWAIASDKLRLVSASHDKTIKIWNRYEGRCTATLVGHRGAVTCLALGDDKIVSGSDDGDVRIWSFGG
ncbi:hypothetical protein M407DRAFT_78084 [Tulasnella calospora MUT 4182]|uniref:F-box domain-containing protein n=2 Tax=Tulasnella calospora MUT 4182 TaxID=1051891 RepID=A0A0C3Q3S5_9AGAM|nr:hypothetical protein M407DRAFT_78084 [Tulasnella calospora MUT 4182]